MFKVSNGLATEITNNVFQINPSVYNLRNSEFKTENVKTVHYGTFLGPKIWKLVPLEIKNSISLQIFKNKIKTWYQKTAPLVYANSMFKVLDLSELLLIFIFNFIYGFYIFTLFNIFNIFNIW